MSRVKLTELHVGLGPAQRVVEGYVVAHIVRVPAVLHEGTTRLTCRSLVSGLLCSKAGLAHYLGRRMCVRAVSNVCKELVSDIPQAQ